MATSQKSRVPSQQSSQATSDKRLTGKNMKVAIVCDWLTGIGGAEKVVLELHKMFPDAPIYTSQYDPTKIDWFKDADVRTTWLQRLPARLKKFLPVLRAVAFSSLDLSEYDLIISSSGAEAKGIKKLSGDSLHICYMHAPTHYYWSRYTEYLKNPGFGIFNPLARTGLKILVWPMRKWDYKAAQRPDILIANSTHTQSEIKKYYNRDSTVIHPPVDIDKNKQTVSHDIPSTKRNGFIIVARQTPYKKVDLAIKACSELELPLKVIGDGPEHQRLKAIAGPTIQFFSETTGTELVGYLMSAEAFIFPGLDDFGIAPVEAMAAGTPVIAYKAGGALDYVVEGKTGVFFNEQSVESLKKALLSFNSNSFDHQQISIHAQQFSTNQFHQKFIKLIDEIRPTKP